jgi:hypothetical protein
MGLTNLPSVLPHYENVGVVADTVDTTSREGMQSTMCPWRSANRRSRIDTKLMVVDKPW